MIAELALSAALLAAPAPPSPFVPNDGWLALPQGEQTSVGFYTACDHGTRLWMVVAPVPGYVSLTSQPDPTCLAPAT